MQIAAAILAQSLAEFEQTWNNYLQAGFTHIDIDVQEEAFAEYATVSLAEITKFLTARLDELANVELSWDLKLDPATLQLDELLALGKLAKKSWRLFLYLDQMPDAKLLKLLAPHQIGLGLLNKKKPASQSLIEEFNSVQFMTIAEDKQGGEFSEVLFERAIDARFQGYEGEICLDGGVNLQSARLIAEVNKEFPINRVSVGSYFQAAPQKELTIRMQKLQLALNL
jgi:pentose-5-phosphate-3-epimerase